VKSEERVLARNLKEIETMENEIKPKFIGPHIEWEPDSAFWADWDIEHEGMEEWGKKPHMMSKIIKDIEEMS